MSTVRHWQNSRTDNGSERKKKIRELPDTVLTGSAVRIEAAKQTAAIDQKNYGRQIDLANKLKKILLDADPPEAEKQAYENRIGETGHGTGAGRSQISRTAQSRTDSRRRLSGNAA
jgi:hypothetical protein